MSKHVSDADDPKSAVFPGHRTVPEVAVMELLDDVRLLDDGRWHLAATQYGKSQWYSRLSRSELMQDAASGVYVGCTGRIDPQTFGFFVKKPAVVAKRMAR